MSVGECKVCGCKLQPGFHFCPNCATQVRPPGECGACGHRNDPTSGFCAGCGAELGEATISTKRLTRPAPTPELPNPPPVGITVQFPFSTAHSFDFAVKEAAQHPSYVLYGKRKQAVHRVTYDISEMDQAVELADQVKGWRRSTVYVDGEKVPWDSVFKFQWCFRQRSASYRPEYYCYGYETDWQFNIWGCINTGMAFREYAGWFCWGRFVDEGGTWEFDRDRILHELQRSLFPFRFCPAMDEGRMKEVFDAFPAKVNPKRNKNWKFVEDSGAGGQPVVVSL